MTDQNPLDPTAATGLPDPGAPTVPTPEVAPGPPTASAAGLPPAPDGSPVPPAGAAAWAAVPPAAAPAAPSQRSTSTFARRPWLVGAAIAGAAIVAGAAGYGLGSTSSSDDRGGDRGALGAGDRDQGGKQAPPSGLPGGGYGPGGQTDPDGDNWQGHDQGRDLDQNQGQDQNGTFGGATPGSGGQGPRTQSGGS